MTRVAINTGSIANDGTGDSLRIAGAKINDNFSEIYNSFGNGLDLISIWNKTTAGVSTTSNVGVGTTNPTSALTVTGNTIVTGVVTATTFVGNLTGNVTGEVNSTSFDTNASGVVVSGTANITGISTFVSDLKVGVNTSSGVVLTSPNGTQYRIIVANNGNLSTTTV